MVKKWNVSGWAVRAIRRWEAFSGAQLHFVQAESRTRLAFHINTRYHFTRYYTSINSLSNSRKFTIKTGKKSVVAPFSTNKLLQANFNVYKATKSLAGCLFKPMSFITHTTFNVRAEGTFWADLSALTMSQQCFSTYMTAPAFLHSINSFHQLSTVPQRVHQLLLHCFFNTPSLLLYLSSTISSLFLCRLRMLPKSLQLKNMSDQKGWW